MIESYIPKFLNCLYHERIKDVIPGQELIDMFHGNQINSAYEMLKACEYLREHRILYSYITVMAVEFVGWVWPKIIEISTSR